MNPGRLHLRVFWDGEWVTGVEIGNSRPQSARLLNGRTPDEARSLIPLLFSACRHGQSAAAHGALARAEGSEHHARGIALAVETAQEHLWRLLLDWPKVLGYEPDLNTYAHWHKRLGEVATGGDWGDAGWDLKKFCEQTFFGMDAAAWLATDGPSSFPVLNTLMTSRWEKPAHALTHPSLLPAGLTARDYYRAMFMELDTGYARYPTWNGAAAETGPYARWHRAPPVAGSTPIAGRLQARLAELASVVQEAAGQIPPQPRCDAYSPEAGSGFSVAETARGLLVHWARLEQGRIADYLIVAPTEWNFHPAGAFRAGLVGLAAPDSDTVERQARQLALALDPCVPYDIDVRLQ
ncbi:nickel-dependent hydrogenase large subunit [Methylococcus sp. EFPC2]|uniref:nickel-dependent hydrogenase large subunit n=1 Tax=Methylococcus sp. EFPC2 TaxID=2812648 RepID=UPI0019684324|nr:nickel-dependent hydrogenase large subunit [Methylococcus sp. EFPC2]QSA97324.1 nickel-dependent hydrogenase large subunit [Methylococcus sp. EFPC2]